MLGPHTHIGIKFMGPGVLGPGYDSVRLSTCGFYIVYLRVAVHWAPAVVKSRDINNFTAQA